ncbi:MAG TPA: rhodanese-like domain-containing protein [Gammaproteobacteria bacterium]|nr:rhodanese-like domain-containing protein [Gammaproteobacteria bacterium]
MDQLTEFVTNNLILFAALLGVLVMLIKAELDHQTSKGSFISPTMAIRLMNNQDDVLVIDTRAATEYDKGHIKSAINVPLAELASGVDKYSAHKDRPVLIYCNTGNTATRAIKLLKNAGFEKVNNLNGGIAAWKEANMPLSRK